MLLNSALLVCRVLVIMPNRMTNMCVSRVVFVATDHRVAAGGFKLASVKTLCTEAFLFINF